MTNKLFYTDPLAAAYMAREFGVELTNIPGEQIKFFDDIKGCIEWKMESDHAFYVGKRFFIHPDSLDIFEPRVGDLVQKIDEQYRGLSWTGILGKELQQPSFEETWSEYYSWMIMNGDDDYTEDIELDGESLSEWLSGNNYKIIQRDNKPFFTPEQEVESIEDSISVHFPEGVPRG